MDRQRLSENRKRFKNLYTVHLRSDSNDEKTLEFFKGGKSKAKIILERYDEDT